MTYSKVRPGTRRDVCSWHQRIVTLARPNFPRTFSVLIALLLLSLSGTALDAAPRLDPASPDEILLTLDNIEPRLTTLPAGRLSFTHK